MLLYLFICYVLYLSLFLAHSNGGKMISINFETKKRDVCDCMMGCLENTALYYGLDYEYLYRGIWVFKFDANRGNGEPFWKRLKTPELVNSHLQLELHHGLRTIECPYEGMEIFIKQLKKELIAGNPVAVFVDAFYCSWAGVYQKGHLPHYCLLTGYEESSGDNGAYVICADPYFMTGQEPWGIDELEQAISRYYLFRKAEPIFGLENWRTDVLLCAKDKLENNIFDGMRALKTEISSNNKFIEELRKQNDMYSFELFYIMKYIGHSRYNHAEFLRYIAENVEEAKGLIEAAECLESASKIWKKVGNMFVKMAYIVSDVRSEKIIEEVKNIMEDAIFLEERTANIIMKG